MEEKGIVRHIQNQTVRMNVDNISRTKAYQKFFKNHPEITWAYLASMVSRNAGWSMADLCSKPYVILLKNDLQRQLFITYERANWLIFSDAYPQLLIYEWSKRTGKRQFHLLEHFHVSKWIIAQWEQFWLTKNEEQLLHALIVNEQHLIQEPVIEAPFFKNKTFHQFVYKWQERLHFSYVLFPTFEGALYGRSIKGFKKVENRIELGKQLGWILMKSPERDKIKQFFLKEEFTGSRQDYQKYINHTFPHTPILRIVYPIIHHEDNRREDWSLKDRFDPDKQLNKLIQLQVKYDLTGWYEKKQTQMMVAAAIENTILNKK
ncbi:DUF2515 domain-containing protein [Bacillus shivajii]|uniref:DUF2515 family protein n=1 Tax=Bacillus shivajii TaxID=1983719 RepID=UPI001CF94F13|nr:DUF2515 family protein [Bacillus shivajii]UCZ54822.1 DUF2515 domain-containing protein [Bacillus shivajii]